MDMRLLSIFCLLLLTTACFETRRTGSDFNALPVPYVVLEDEMGATMKIGVTPEINAEQLRATLSRAAADHQNDRARDLLSERFLIEAYSMAENSTERRFIGRLSRYVPPKNGSEGENGFLERIFGKRDVFYITASE